MHTHTHTHTNKTTPLTPSIAHYHVFTDHGLNVLKHTVPAEPFKGEPKQKTQAGLKMQ